METKKIMLFRSLKESLLFFGIPSPFERKGGFNLRNSMFLLYFLISTIMMFLYIIWENPNLVQYSSAIFATSLSVITVIGFLGTIATAEKGYKYLNLIEDNIQMRKFLY